MFLHGHDSHQDSYLDTPMFAALSKLGRDAPVIAFPYGAVGAHSPALHTAPGGHTHDYWMSHWQDYLPFYAAALRRCRP